MDFEDTLLLFFPIMATYFGKLGCLQNEEPYSAGAKLRERDQTTKPFQNVRGAIPTVTYPVVSLRLSKTPD